MRNLTKQAKISRVLNSVAAGTSNQNSAVVDMLGFRSVTFLAAFGALTAGQVTSIKAQQGNAADGSDMADLAGSSVGPLADGDGTKLLVLELYDVRERYVRLVVVRGTANAVIDGVIAIQAGARNQPTTHGASVKAAEFHLAPAEGTA